MNGSLTTNAHPESLPAGLAPATAAASDLSCRVPLLVLFLGAGTWLVVAAVLGLIASIKFHSPAFLADTAWLTYGRVRPAALDSALYGFCVQAGLAIGLWLITRLGRTVLAEPLAVTVGAVIWNLGIAVGLGAILGGDSSGHEMFEMPGYAALILFVGYILIAGWAVTTFHRRRVPSAFVSQWYLLAALFWFPWVFSTATLLLLFFPVRGIAQPVIAWWFSQNFLVVWLDLVGLATGFYVVTRAVKRDLDNHNLALFAFWTLLLFGSWACIPFSAPLPAWMPVLSRIAGLLSAFTLVAVALVLAHTTAGVRKSLWGDTSSRFVAVGVLSFLGAGALRVIADLIAPVFPLNFSWYRVGVMHLQWYGFFAMIAFGAAYYILPKVTSLDWPRPGFVRLHFWLSSVGIALLVIPLLVGGTFETSRLLTPAVAFNDITRSNVHFLRISTIGDLLILAGNLLFVLNVCSLLIGTYRARVVALYAVVTARVPESRPLPAATAREGGLKR